MTGLKPVPRRGQPCISVVFSFWNEEDVLPELIRRTREPCSTAWWHGAKWAATS